jgi:hypothetical protein
MDNHFPRPACCLTKKTGSPRCVVVLGLVALFASLVSGCTGSIQPGLRKRPPDPDGLLAAGDPLDVYDNVVGPLPVPRFSVVGMSDGARVELHPYAETRLEPGEYLFQVEMPCSPKYEARVSVEALQHVTPDYHIPLLSPVSVFTARETNVVTAIPGVGRSGVVLPPGTEVRIIRRTNRRFESNCGWVAASVVDSAGVLPVGTRVDLSSDLLVSEPPVGETAHAWVERRTNEERLRIESEMAARESAARAVGNREVSQGMCAEDRFEILDRGILQLKTFAEQFQPSERFTVSTTFVSHDILVATPQGKQIAVGGGAAGGEYHVVVCAFDPVSLKVRSTDGHTRRTESFLPCVLNGGYPASARFQAKPYEEFQVTIVGSGCALAAVFESSY